MENVQENIESYNVAGQGINHSKKSTFQEL